MWWALPNWKILFGFSKWSHLGEFKLHLKMFFWRFFETGAEVFNFDISPPWWMLPKALPSVQGNAASTFGGIPSAAECCRPWSGDGIGEMIATTYRCLGETWWLAVDAWSWGVAQFSDQPMWWEEKKTECWKNIYIYTSLSPFPHDFPSKFLVHFLTRRSFAHWTSRRPHRRRDNVERYPKTAGFTMKNWDVTSWSVEFTFVPKKRSEPTENGEFTKWKCKFGQEICRCCNWEDLGIDPTRMEQTWKDMYQCIHRYPLPTNVRNRMGNQKGKDVSWACPETDRFVTPLGKMPY